MAERLPLVIVNGQIEQLQPGDTIAAVFDADKIVTSQWEGVLNGQGGRVALVVIDNNGNVVVSY